MSKTLSKKEIEELRLQFQIRGYKSDEYNNLISQLLSRLNILCDPTREFFKGAVRNTKKGEDPRDFTPRSRLQVSYMIVWTLLHTFRRSVTGEPRAIYGGYLRDYVIRNRAPNDIDIRLLDSDIRSDKRENLRKWKKDLANQLKIDWKIYGNQTYTTCSNNGLLEHCDRFNPGFVSNKVLGSFIASNSVPDLTTDRDFRVSDDMKRVDPSNGKLGTVQQLDAVIPSAFDVQSIGVPSDIDNFILTRDGLKLKYKPDGVIYDDDRPHDFKNNFQNPFSTLAESLYNCMTNKAVYYFEPELRNGVCLNNIHERGSNNERLNRIKSRGFNILNINDNCTPKNLSNGIEHIASIPLYRLVKYIGNKKYILINDRNAAQTISKYVRLLYKRGQEPDLKDDNNKKTPGNKKNTGRFVGLEFDEAIPVEKNGPGDDDDDEERIKDRREERIRNVKFAPQRVDNHQLNNANEKMPADEERRLVHQDRNETPIANVVTQHQHEDVVLLVNTGIGQFQVNREHIDHMYDNAKYYIAGALIVYFFAFRGGYKSKKKRRRISKKINRRRITRKKRNLLKKKKSKENLIINPFMIKDEYTSKF